MPVDDNIFTNDVRVFAKAALPTAVADHRQWVGKRCAVFLRRKHSPSCGLHAEYLKIISRYFIAPKSFVVAVVAQSHRRDARCVYAGENVIALTEIQVVGIGKGPQ